MFDPHLSSVHTQQPNFQSFILLHQLKCQVNKLEKLYLSHYEHIYDRILNQLYIHQAKIQV